MTTLLLFHPSDSPAQDRDPTDMLPGETIAEYIAQKIKEARARGWCEEVVAYPEWNLMTPQEQIQCVLGEYEADPRMFRAKDRKFYIKGQRKVSTTE